MLKATKRLIILSEQVNKYGFRALVDGVDLAQYERNPILLWMHYRAFGKKNEVILPLGNVIELKVETIDGIGKCLTGLPVFDDTDDFAVSIYNKYENGTLRMGSAGLLPVEWSSDETLIIQGQRGETLSRSILEEVSIADIGADNNALSIALYDSNHTRIELSSSDTSAVIPLLINNKKSHMEKIELSAAKAAAILGTDVKSVDQFETKVMEAVQLAASQKTEIDNLKNQNQALQKKVDDAEKVQLSSKVEALVQGAVDDRKITADEKPHFVTLAMADYASVEKILGGKQGAPTVQSQIQTKKEAKVSLYANKTWEQLDQEGLLVKLKSDDPNLFKELFKAAFDKEYEG